MARRSRPPRQRKSRAPEAPRLDIAEVIPVAPAPSEEAVTATSADTEPPDDLAALDAGWD
jgi:hypothetical protein